MTGPSINPVTELLDHLDADIRDRGYTDGAAGRPSSGDLITSWRQRRIYTTAYEAAAGQQAWVS